MNKPFILEILDGRLFVVNIIDQIEKVSSLRHYVQTDGLSADTKNRLCALFPMMVVEDVRSAAKHFLRLTFFFVFPKS